MENPLHDPPGPPTPELSCTVVFEDYDSKALHPYRDPEEPLPTEPPKLNSMVRMVRQLEGFLGRKHDDRPGPKSLWLPMSRLQGIS